MYPGPNIMGLRPCVRVVLAFEPSPVEPLGGAFRERAQALLVAALGERFTEEVIHSDTPEGVFREAAMLLQRAYRHPVQWSRANALAGHHCEVAFEFMHAPAVDSVVRFALTLTQVALGSEKREAFETLCRRLPEEMAIRLRHLFFYDRQTTAARLGVPCQTGNGMPGNFVRIGQGASAQISIASYTAATSHLGKEVAAEKNQTYYFLVERGLPVAQQALAYSAGSAVRAAERIGFPVIVKPLRANRGRGVRVNLRSAEEVRSAYDFAAETQSSVVVERYLAGDDYRMLVIGGKFVAAVKRLPPCVEGDGVHTLDELIAITNSAERRDGFFFDPLSVDAEVLRVLAEQDCHPGSVPQAGQRVFFRRSATPESTTQDVTDLVHPDNRAVAVAAAQACLLDVAGIDFLSTDIAQSWKDNGAGIVEVNAGPALDMHMYPREGARRDPSWHVIRSRLPAHAPGRIPVVMVTGRYNKKSTVAWIGNLLALCGHSVAVEDAGALAGVPFSSPCADAGVLEVSLKTLALEGLPLDRAAVTVITDGFPAFDDLAAALAVPEIAARLHRLAVDVACEALVIDGASATLRQAAKSRPAWQTGYVWDAANNPDDAPLAEHLGAGGWAVVSQADAKGDAWMMLLRGEERHAIARMQDIFRHAEGENGVYPNQQEALRACAALIGLGMGREMLAAPLHAAAQEPSRLSTLQAFPANRPAMASADPRDALAIGRLAALLDAGGYVRPWVMLHVERDAAASIDSLYRELDAHRPYWCLTGENTLLPEELMRLGVPEWRILRLGDPETAWETMKIQAQADALIVLLSIDELLRRRLCRAALPPCAEEAAPGGAWDAAELACQFDGAWVNGPGKGWRVAGSIAWGAENARRGDLAVIPGVPDDLSQLDDIEKNVRNALERGACGVVATMVPPGLPRWQPVLVCDDPRRGLVRLARSARRRFRGAVVAVSGARDRLIAATLHRDWQNLYGAAPGGVFLDEAGIAEGNPPFFSAVLALARTPPHADVALHPVAWDVLAAGLIKPELWIAMVTDRDSALRAIGLLESLPAACKVIVALPSSALASWEKRLLARRTTLFTLVEIEDDSVVSERFDLRLARAAHALIPFPKP